MNRRQFSGWWRRRGHPTTSRLASAKAAFRTAVASWPASRGRRGSTSQRASWVTGFPSGSEAFVTREPDGRRTYCDERWGMHHADAIRMLYSPHYNAVNDALSQLNFDFQRDIDARSGRHPVPMVLLVHPRFRLRHPED